MEGTTTIEGVDGRLIILGFAVVVFVCYAWWIRRLIDIEPEVHSFRATAPRRPNRTLQAGLGLAVVAAVLAAIGAPR